MKSPSTRPIPAAADVVVVGAGFSGMYMLHRLRSLGLSTVVFEANPDVGGTWYSNCYPGARVDIESFAYSYSFDRALEQEYEWTERFSAQPGLRQYIGHVADRFDLRKDIVFGTRVATARWDDSEQRWSVTTEHGDTVAARFLVMATGCLSTAIRPKIDGLDTFQGASYHTGQWPQDGVDFRGLRVGLIGTGSSGVQAIPVIAEQAASLTVFQRTPAYALPARNRALEPGESESQKEAYPVYRQLARVSGFGIPVEPPNRSALEVSDAERDIAFEKAWEEGGLLALLYSFNDITSNPAANDMVKAFVHRKIHAIVRDPKTAADLCPDYPFWSKRPCLDTGYYDAYNRPNVHLVNLQREPLVKVTEAGVQTTAGEYAFDVIVYATGFDAITGSFTAVDIRGKGDLSLREAWAAGPRTYLGLCVAGFPNLFMITGPGSPSVLSHVLLSIEQHVEYVSDTIGYMERRGLKTIEATLSAQDEWVDTVNQLASHTLFPKGNSWYMGANVPGKPRVFMPYAGGVGTYREKCDQVAIDGYTGFQLGG